MRTEVKYYVSNQNPSHHIFVAGSVLIRITYIYHVREVIRTVLIRYN